MVLIDPGFPEVLLPSPLTMIALDHPRRSAYDPARPALRVGAKEDGAMQLVYDEAEELAVEESAAAPVKMPVPAPSWNCTAVPCPARADGCQ